MFHSLVLTTINDDAVTVTVSPTGGLRTDESGGTASFSIVLGSAPSSDVTITVASSDPGEGVASPGTLTFTDVNWSVPQTVTVTGVDDAVDDGDQSYTIVTTLCPGGKERMRQLMEMVRHGRLDVKPLLTHRASLDEIVDAYDLFGHQRDGVLKVAVTP